MTTTPVELVPVTIDGVETSVPKGTLIIRAAEQLGIHIPRFCDHPLLAPVAACRQCLVDVGTPGRDGGEVRFMPKPQPACATTVSPGMVVKTAATSQMVEKAQHGVMELLLINHPLDCPICDKGGECPLQNQAMTDGRAVSRFEEAKRHFPKPIELSSAILLDRERCIVCQRCTRFMREIPNDPFIDLQQRGAKQQIGRFDTRVLDFAGNPEVAEEMLDNSGRPFSSYFAGNIIQICPVGALTSASYRFRARPFDLRSVPSVAEHDANCSAIRIDTRSNVVLRRLSGDDAAVNEEWISDKDRFAFTWQRADDRLATPLVRVGGVLEPASWPLALQAAAAGLSGLPTGVLTGGRMPMEDAYAYAKFARTVLGTNDIDFRARVHSTEEGQFLAHQVAGRDINVTFDDLEAAPAVLLAGFEPEEEGGIVFLRLYKGVEAGAMAVTTIAPFASPAAQRLAANVIETVPGDEAAALDAITDGDLLESLKAPGALILVGERLAGVVGAYTAALDLAARTGARIAWIPRRAGERGAVEAGALPNLLPGGRLVSDPAARVDVATVWGARDLPAGDGRDFGAILAAAASGDLDALLVGGLQIADLPDAETARAALTKAFVVSLEVRASDVTEYADVVFPVAPPSERGGTFVNWEGRRRPFGQVLTSTAQAEHWVLTALAEQMGATLGLGKLADVHAELDQFTGWDGTRADAPAEERTQAAVPGEGEAVLATWPMQLDNGRGQDGQPFLAATARQPVARANPATVRGSQVTVSTDAGSITLPLVAAAMPEGVVWLPRNSGDSTVYATLAATAGSLVRLDVTS